MDGMVFSNTTGAIQNSDASLRNDAKEIVGSEGHNRQKIDQQERSISPDQSAHQGLGPQICEMD